MTRRRKLFRRWWSKPHIRRNYLTGYNGYHRVFKYFKLNDEDEFINFTRIPEHIFEYLYQLVRVSLIKRSRRPPLPSELRLSLTLNYLAHVDSIKKNMWFYNIGETTIKKVIPEFMSDLFYHNCIGALDGKHCKIKKPPNSGSLFYNYKKFFSIVLMACCDSKKRFIWANIGDYEKIIMSTVCLHNMLLDFKYNEVGNRWNNINNQQVLPNEPQDVENIIQHFRLREQLCIYFVSPQGSVPWQWEKM
ncbi:uncharacterized protein LOC131663424 [Phymastichus coffea]|uniref:uncharacterized protein LOC131663424 n=1 Tax=Phymastichus coffea TaxID=108790 RepID=UPI00273C158E|nr:uncharacterized protein LOC131663424 [Phymastichus coffea]